MMKEALNVIPTDLSDSEISSHMGTEGIESANLAVFTPKENESLSSQRKRLHLAPLELFAGHHIEPSFSHRFPVGKHRMRNEGLGGLVPLVSRVKRASFESLSGHVSVPFYSALRNLRLFVPGREIKGP
jgi:hypothetical protein